MKRLALFILPSVVHAETELLANPFNRGHNFLIGANDEVKCDDKGDKCDCCVESAEKFIWKHVEDVLKEWCDGDHKPEAIVGKELAQNPFLQQTMQDEGCDGGDGKKCIKKLICGFHHKMPRVAQGFFFAKAHPMEISHAYCYGKSMCGPHQQEQATVDNDKLLSDIAAEINPRMLMQQIESESPESGETESSSAEREEGNEPDWTAKLEKFAAEFADNSTDAAAKFQEMIDFKNTLDNVSHSIGSAYFVNQAVESEQLKDHWKGKWGKWGGDHDDHHGGHVCKECYIKVFKMIMWISVEKTKAKCMNTKCPVLRKFCEFAGGHKPEALGMIMSWVEPWKFAIGRCWHHDGEGGHHGGIGHHDHEGGPRHWWQKLFGIGGGHHGHHGGPHGHHDGPHHGGPHDGPHGHHHHGPPHGDFPPPPPPMPMDKDGNMPPPPPPPHGFFGHIGALIHDMVHGGPPPPPPPMGFSEDGTPIFPPHEGPGPYHHAHEGHWKPHGHPHGGPHHHGPPPHGGPHPRPGEYSIDNIGSGPHDPQPEAVETTEVTVISSPALAQLPALAPAMVYV